MAGEIQLNSTTMATESSGTITLSNVNSATNRTNLGLGSIATQAADSVSISGGNITGGTIGSSVVFPALGNSAVGTVSESSGTPTGDVVERGSNSNGEYVKFADGTLICTFKDDSVASFAISGSYGSLYQGLRNFTLPATYIDTNYAVSCRVQYSTGASWSQGYANSTTVVTLQAWDVVSRDGTATTRVAYLTIGRWY
jgi:hypothetical protein